MTYAWFDCGNGRQVYRRIEETKLARSHLPCPMIASDTMEPVQSMADGRYYSSKSAMRASYRADGNPQGIEYSEVGTEYQKTPPKPVTPKVDPQKVSDSVEKAFARLERGEIPTT